MKEKAGGLLGGPKGMLAPPPKLLGGPGPPGPPSSYAYEESFAREHPEYIRTIKVYSMPYLTSMKCFIVRYRSMLLTTVLVLYVIVIGRLQKIKLP